MATFLRNISFLVVEDDPDLLAALADGLEMFGATTQRAIDGKMAREMMRDLKIDVIICDVRMPILGGAEFLKELKDSKKPYPPFFFLTGYSDMTEQEALQLGASGLLIKPIRIEMLAQAAASVLFSLKKSN